MRYLKEASIKSRKFKAVFVNGMITQSHDVATFFMMMSDKNVEPDDLDSYIHIGKTIDPEKPWSEIQRVADSFVSGDWVKLQPLSK